MLEILSSPPQCYYFTFFSSERSFLDVKPAVSNQPWIELELQWVEQKMRAPQNAHVNFVKFSFWKVLTEHGVKHLEAVRAVFEWCCDAVLPILNFKILFLTKRMEFCSSSEKSIRRRGSVAACSVPGWARPVSLPELSWESSYRISKKNGDVDLEALGFEKIQCGIPGF